MPLYKNKNKGGQILVHRPDGMKYADGVAIFRDFNDDRHVLSTQVKHAFDEAIGKFEKEFGRRPNWDCVVVETCITRQQISARLMEMDEE